MKKEANTILVETAELIYQKEHPGRGWVPFALLNGSVKVCMYDPERRRVSYNDKGEMIKYLQEHPERDVEKLIGHEIPLSKLFRVTKGSTKLIEAIFADS